MSVPASPIPRQATILLIAGSLAACATPPTPYQRNLPGQAIEGGYSDVRIGQDRYRVSFAGNCYTSRDRVEGYLLYRAAELTLEQDRDWFLILDRMTERKARTYSRPDPFYRPWYGPAYANWRPYWYYYVGGRGWRTWDPVFGDPYWADQMDMITVEKFEAHAEIKLNRGPIPAGEERAFDARKVVAELDPTIERPASSGGMC